VKIERRENSVFVSHNGLTVFFNRFKDGYGIKTTYREQSNPLADKWLVAGKMSVNNTDYDRLVKLLGELV
jgi:hypothetical protein